MRLYSTQYIQNGATFSSLVLADNDREVERLINYRGIGEVIVGFPVLNYPEFADYSEHELYQELAFTAWVASKSWNSDLILGPSGWLTQYLCLRSAPNERIIPRINEMLVKTNAVRAEYGMPRIKRMS